MKHLFLAAAITLLSIAPAMAQGYGNYGSSSYGGTTGTQQSPSSSPYESSGQHEVQGYTNQRGTYVEPHMQTNPNTTRSDNWSTQGNVNPYTGQAGTHNPYR